MLPQSTYSWWSHDAHYKAITILNFLLLFRSTILLVYGLCRLLQKCVLAGMQLLLYINIYRQLNFYPLLLPTSSLWRKQLHGKQSGLHRVISKPSFHIETGLHIDIMIVKMLSHQLFSLQSQSRLIQNLLINYLTYQLNVNISKTKSVLLNCHDHGNYLRGKCLKCPLQTYCNLPVSPPPSFATHIVWLPLGAHC